MKSQFPDTDANDGVAYLPDASAFEIVTDGCFCFTDSLHRHAESWIGEDDKLHNNTEDARVATDSR